MLVGFGQHRQMVRRHPVSQGSFATTQDFAIGADCANQALILQVAGGSGQLGAEFTLRSVDISRR